MYGMHAGRRPGGMRAVSGADGGEAARPCQTAAHRSAVETHLQAALGRPAGDSWSLWRRTRRPLLGFTADKYLIKRDAPHWGGCGVACAWQP